MNMGWWGAPAGRPRGGRFKRGMLKFMLLKVIDAVGEKHGYELMRIFSERGFGRVGPGSLYPLLSSLEEEGFIEGRDEDGRRVYRVTDAGRRKLQSMAEHLLGPFTFEETQERSDEPDLREAMQRLGGAVQQAAQSAKPETVAKIGERIDALRKEIYTILANE